MLPVGVLEVVRIQVLRKQRLGQLPDDFFEEAKVVVLVVVHHLVFLPLVVRLLRHQLHQIDQDLVGGGTLGLERHAEEKLRVLDLLDEMDYFVATVVDVVHAFGRDLAQDFRDIVDDLVGVALLLQEQDDPVE